MLKKNYIKEKLKNNLPVIGTWVVVPSVVNLDIICSSGIDFVIIDREHGPITFETAQEMVITCESRNVSPLMRLGNIEKSFIQNAMDIGVHGVQIPNVESKKEALDVINFSKYPPVGDRGFSPFTRAGDYTNRNSKNMLKDANSNTIVVLNIEGQNALKNIDEIVSLKNIDVIFVGLFDLSKELNIKPSQLAILWCLNNKNVSTVIIGASKLSQLKENLDSINYSDLITKDIIKEINNY